MSDLLILGIETSGILCSVAWVQNGSTLLEYNLERKNEHAVLLAALIEKGFKKLGLNPRKTNFVVVASGPGSFTGLRIGMSYAKGFCYGHDIPLIPVTNFEVLAHHADDSIYPIYTLIEAGKERYYTGRFAEDKTRLDEKNVYTLSQLEEIIPDNALIIVHEEISKGYFTQYYQKTVNIIDGHYSAAILCTIGQKKTLKERRLNLNEIEPLYLQKFAGIT